LAGGATVAVGMGMEAAEVGMGKEAAGAGMVVAADMVGATMVLRVFEVMKLLRGMVAMAVTLGKGAGGDVKTRIPSLSSAKKLLRMRPGLAGKGGLLGLSIGVVD